MQHATLYHYKGTRTTREGLETIPLPPASATYQPVPYNHLIDLVLKATSDRSLELAGEDHCISRGGQRYFGVFEFNSPSTEHALAVGIRSSYDQSMIISLASGIKVFVCENMSFNGEFTLFRKHTKFVLRDLPGIVGRSVDNVIAAHLQQEVLDAALREYDLGTAEVNDLIIKSFERGVIGCHAIPKILKEWAAPSYPEFKPRSAYSLLNCFTQVLKESPIMEMVERTTTLNSLFKERVGEDILAT
jgi:hypothetical protein